jgi:hypothetical protein
MQASLGGPMRRAVSGAAANPPRVHPIIDPVIVNVLVSHFGYGLRTAAREVAAWRDGRSTTPSALRAIRRALPIAKRAAGMENPRIRGRAAARRNPWTHVVRFGEGNFPAWDKGDGTLLVDLRSFAPDGKTLVFRPERLRSRFTRVPEDIIAAAATSSPPGFVRVPKNPRARPSGRNPLSKREAAAVLREAMHLTRVARGLPEGTRRSFMAGKAVGLTAAVQGHGPRAARRPALRARVRARSLALNDPGGRWYYGHKRGGGVEKFWSARKPTEASHGHRYGAVTGPFPAEKAMDKMYGFWWQAGPHTVVRRGKVSPATNARHEMKALLGAAGARSAGRFA